MTNEEINQWVNALPAAVVKQWVPKEWGPCEEEDARLYVWDKFMDLKDSGQVDILHFLKRILKTKGNLNCADTENRGSEQVSPVNLGGCK